MKLTDLAARSLPQGKYFDSMTPGFGIRVGKQRRTWVVMRGKQRQLIRLGHYPQMSLSEARFAGKQLLAATQLDLKRITFKDAYDLYVKTRFPQLRENTRIEYERILTRHYLPTLATRRLDSVNRHMVLAITDELIRTPAMHIAATACGKTFFKWCIGRHYLDRSPLEAAKVAKPNTRSRVLTDEELRQVWIAASKFGGQYGTIIKLLVLTGMRRGECAALNSTWIQNDRVTLPKHITKNGRAHTFPIGSIAIATLPQVTGRLFPAQKLPNGHFNTFAVTKREFDKLLPGIEPYCVHDLRRTYRTNLARLRVPPHVAERLINHVGNRSPLEAVYDIHNYWEEMVEAVQKYDNWLTSLLGR